MIYFRFVILATAENKIAYNNININLYSTVIITYTLFCCTVSNFSDVFIAFVSARPPFRRDGVLFVTLVSGKGGFLG